MNSECPQTCHDTQFLIPRVPEKFFFNRWGTGVRYFGSFAGCAKALKKKNILLEEIRVGEGGFFTPIFTPSEVMSPALTKQNGTKGAAEKGPPLLGFTPLSTWDSFSMPSMYGFFRRFWL